MIATSEMVEAAARTMLCCPVEARAPALRENGKRRHNSIITEDYFAPG